MTFLKWLLPGLKVKRWLTLTVIGLLLIGASFSILSESEILGSIEKAIRLISLNLVGSSIGFTAFMVFVFGTIFLIFGFRQMIRSLILAVNPQTEQLIEILYTKRHLDKGPKIVVIGGGTGIPALLRGLKGFTTNITAIVTVADDGGSSGRLRGEFGILPPGDIRNCLVALADKETLMEQVLQYRFSGSKELGGHNLGNLLIAAMSEMTGSFEEAIREMSKVLAIKGQVLPSTLKEVILGAEMPGGEIVYGESKIPEARKVIQRVFLEPADIRANPEAIKAIEEADMIILGPGSLFTSVLPNLLIKDIAEAIKRSKALKAYICNIMTQPGETDDFTASRHAKEIIKHVGLGCFDYMVANKEEIPKEMIAKYKGEGSIMVKADRRKIEKLGVEVLEAKLVYHGDVVRHDPEKLANAVLRLMYKERAKLKGVHNFDLLWRWYRFLKKGKH